MSLSSSPALPDPREHRWLVLLAAGCLLLQLLLVLLAGWQGGFLFINAAGRMLPDRIAESLTQAGDTLFALTLFLLIAKRYPGLLWQAVLAALIAALLSRGIKALAAEPRPAAVLGLEQFRQLGPVLRRSSFPSGHAVTAFVSAACLACHLPAWWQRALLLLLALLVGLSRVVVGAHWPVDVCAGAAIGLLSAYLGLQLARRWPAGLRPRVHQGLVAVLVVCALVQLFVKPDYALARPLVVLSALLALVVATRDYLPLLLKRQPATDS